MINKIINKMRNKIISLSYIAGTLGFIAILTLNFPLMNLGFGNDIDYREEIFNMSFIPCMQLIYDEVKTNETMSIDEFIVEKYIKHQNKIEHKVSVITEKVKNKPVEERRRIYAETRKKCMDGIIASRKR